MTVQASGPDAASQPPPPNQTAAPAGGGRRLRSPRNLAALAVVLALIIAIGAVVVVKATQGSSTPGATGPGPTKANAHQASLEDAIAHATVIGPTDPARRLDITLTLENRSAQQLSSLIAAGQTVNPSQFSAQFGPDPRLVQAAIDRLKQLKVEASWNPGSSILTVTAPVSVINSALGVTITDYKGADGRAFFAPDKSVTIPTGVAAIITSVSGLDNYTEMQSKARRVTSAVHPGGLTPDEVRAFYNVNSLASRGLDGSGMTIVFPELDDLVDDSDLQAFSRKFNLPRADLTIKRDSAWGDPTDKGKPGVEATLDVEIAHAFAPKAKLIAYIGAPSVAQGVRRDEALVRENPGAIVSDSLGQCEARINDAGRTQEQDVWDRAAATGMTHFVASGDLGAYDCNGHADVLSVDFPSALPSVTAVGGTSAFLGTQPGYYKEVAWGDAISGQGAGGGVSLNYARPDWQKGQGVDNGDSGSPAARQVPDISGVADGNTGYDIIVGGSDHTVGGTSAAAPMWAGIAALIDQDFAASGLKPIGFANPAIYWMANQSDLNPAPFHDVTVGNNFRYKAGAGWDYITGWGTPDVGALDQAWQKYQRQAGR